MTTEYMIRYDVPLEGRAAQAIYDAFKCAVSESNVRETDFAIGPGLALPKEDPVAASLTMNLLADSEEELLHATDAVVNGLEERGFEVFGNPTVISARTVEPKVAGAAGVHYDESTCTLEIDTQAPRARDLDVMLHNREDGRVTALLSTDGPSGRVEEAFVTARIVIHRIVPPNK